MYTANYVAEKAEEMKHSGNPLQWVAWQVALLCVGWAYVFGAWGEYCDPSNRRSRARDDHPTIKSKCKNFNGSDNVPGGCVGCQWFLGSASSDPKTHEGRTRFFDCRGFTYWILQLVFGFKLQGSGATSQWNTASNWKAKGKVSDGIPADTLVCLFVRNGNTMEHTGFGWNNETCECSVGVQHFTKRNKKWTDWAIPACIGGDVPTPTPPEPEQKPTLRRGSSGAYVNLAQTKLLQKGYDLGSFGVDGEFGAATEKAVREFQRDHTDPDGNPLTVDGVIGQKTWAALDAVEPKTKYTVTIPHLSKSQADALVRQYPGSTMTEERG